MASSDDISVDFVKEMGFTIEEIKEIENARNMPIIFDEECPETTPERAMRFRRVNPTKNKMAF